MVLFIYYKDDEWIAKPDRPFGKLQLELYRRAFNLNEKDFGISLELEVLQNRTYISKRSWFKIIERMEDIKVVQSRALQIRKKEVLLENI